MSKKKLQQQIDDIRSQMSFNQAVCKDWVKKLNVAVSNIEAHILLNTPKCSHHDERGTPYYGAILNFTYCPKCGDKLWNTRLKN